MAKTQKKPTHTPLKIDQNLRRQIEQVATIKTWSFVTVARKAVEALIRTDPQLRDLESLHQNAS